MLHLLDFAPEVIHEILTEVDITDLAAISRTCHHLRDYVAGDVLLWKNHYLKHFVGLMLMPPSSCVCAHSFL